MAALGELVVSLSANIAAFTGPMDKAAHVMQQRMAGIEKAAKQAGAVVGGALAAGAGLFAAQMQSIINAADETGKAAAALGVTSEALSGLRYAAELSGVEATKLSEAIHKLNKAAADGNDAFASMGVSVRAADGSLKTADALLGDVADKFASYKDGAEKSALAQRLFGETGARLIPLLNSGATGISAMADEARKLGVVFSNDTAMSAAAVNDNLTRMKRAQEGIVAQVTASMLPTIKNLSDRFVDAAQNSELLRTAATLLAGTLKTLVSAGAIVYGAFQAVGKGIAAVAAAAVQAAQGEFQRAWDILRMGGEDMASSVVGSVNTVMDIWTEASANAAVIANAPGGGLAAPIVAAAAKSKEAAKAIKEQADKLAAEGEAIYRATRTPAEQLNIEFARLNELLAAGAINWDTYGRAVMDAQDRLMPMKEAVKDTTKEAEDSFKDLRDAIDGWGKDSAQAIVDFAVAGKTSFKDMIESMISDLARMAIYRNVTAPLAAAVGGMDFGSMLGSFFGGARAAGGPVSAGKTYLVGERGPELVTMGGSGFVTPNHALGGGGGAVNVTVVNQGGQQMEARSSATPNATGGLDVEIVLYERVKGRLLRETQQGGGLAPMLENKYGLSAAAGARR